jgi:ribosomal protein S4
MDGRSYEVAPGDQKEIDEKERDIYDSKPKNDAAGNYERAVEQEKTGSQSKCGKDSNYTEEIELAGGSKGSKSGDDHQE